MFKTFPVSHAVWSEVSFLFQGKHQEQCLCTEGCFSDQKILSTSRVPWKGGRTLWMGGLFSLLVNLSLKRHSLETIICVPECCLGVNAVPFSGLLRNSLTVILRSQGCPPETWLEPTSTCLKKGCQIIGDIFVARIQDHKCVTTRWWSCCIGKGYGTNCEFLLERSRSWSQKGKKAMCPKQGMLDGLVFRIKKLHAIFGRVHETFLRTMLRVRLGVCN